LLPDSKLRPTDRTTSALASAHRSTPDSLAHPPQLVNSCLTHCTHLPSLDVAAIPYPTTPANRRTATFWPTPLATVPPPWWKEAVQAPPKEAARATHRPPTASASRPRKTTNKEVTHPSVTPAPTGQGGRRKESRRRCRFTITCAWPCARLRQGKASRPIASASSTPSAGSSRPAHSSACQGSSSIRSIPAATNRASENEGPNNTPSCNGHAGNSNKNYCANALRLKLVAFGTFYFLGCNRSFDGLA
jgi:hypothetical protein